MNPWQMEVTPAGMSDNGATSRFEPPKVGGEWIPGVLIERDMSGGMGLVYAVRTRPRDRGRGKQYVLKTFRSGEGAEWTEHGARFFNELEILLTLERHPNVLTLDAVVAHHDRPIMLLGFIDAETLRARLARGALSLEETLRNALQLCDGMTYVGDEKHIVHRDLKPENLLVGEDGNLYIIDFGLAKASLSDVVTEQARPDSLGERDSRTTDEDEAPRLPSDWHLTRVDQLIGTPDYMAPELLERSGSATTRSDIYAAGLILGEMLTGQRLRELLRAQHERKVISDSEALEDLLKQSGAPSALRTIVVKCLAPDPVARYQTFCQVRDELHTVFQSICGEPFPRAQVQQRTPMELSNQAVSLGKLGRPEEALLLIDRALAIAPHHTVCLVNRAHCLRSLGRLDEAFRTARHACESGTTEDDRAFAWEGMASLYEDAGDVTMALWCLQQSVECNAHYETWARMGQVLAREKRYDEAVKCLDRALSGDGTNESIWAFKGDCLMKAQSYEGALRCFERALELRPRWSQAVVHKSYCLALLGRVNEARTFLRSCFQDNPKSDEIRSALALLSSDREQKTMRLQGLIIDGKFQEAIAVSDELLRQEKCSAEVWNWRGICFEQLGRNEEALASYDRALQLNHSIEVVHVNRGNVLDKMGRAKDALDAYDHALLLNARNPATLINKAVCLAGLGQVESAMTCCEQALEIDPDYRGAWRTLGHVLVTAERYAEAHRCIQQAIASRPNDSTAWADKGACEVRMGLTKEAAASFARVLELEPNDWRSWANVGSVLSSTGREREAIHYLRRAAELCETNADLWAQLSRAHLKCATARKSDEGIDLSHLADAVRYMCFADQRAPDGRFSKVAVNMHQAFEEAVRILQQRARALADTGQVQDALYTLRTAETICRKLNKNRHVVAMLACQAIVLAQKAHEFSEALLLAEKAQQLATDGGFADAADEMTKLRAVIETHASFQHDATRDQTQ